MKLRLIGFVVIAIAGIARSQDGAPGPHAEVEVASISPRAPGGPSAGFINYIPGKGAFTAENITALQLIEPAYRVRDFEITGGPAWINDEHFDITAKGAVFSPIVQALLADRFHLMFHRETKELPVYYLTAAQGGVKLVEPKEGSCIMPSPEGVQQATPGQPPPDYCGMLRVGRNGEMNAFKIGMEKLTYFFANVLGRKVIDCEPAKRRALDSEVARETINCSRTVKGSATVS